MASTIAVASSSAALVAAPSVMERCRSSGSPAFGSVRFAPVVRRSGAVKVNATVRASAAEESKASGRQALVGLLAAGAILVSGMPAFAVTGPGGDGASRTAQKADQLLNSADKLTENDSPTRFSEGVQNTGSSAKQAGSAAASNVQNVADDAVTQAKENLEKAKKSFGNVIPGNKTSAIDQTFTVSDASSAIDDAKSSASGAAGDAKGFLDQLGDKIKGSGSNAGDVAADVKGKASDAVSDAQSKLPKKGGSPF